MKLKITNEIVNKYPILLIGVVVAHGVRNRVSDSRLEEFTQETVKQLRISAWTPETLHEHPYIAAWRDTYLSFGVKSKSVRKDPPTAENIIRYVLAGNDLREISVIVNAYLAVEIESFLPIGGYDIDSVEGDIVLRFSPGGEMFVHDNGDARITKPGEVVYSDDKRVLTYRWNKMDCGETKITPDTTNFILCIEAADNRIPIDVLENTTQRLKEILERFCPGEYISFVADVTKAQEWQIE